MQMMESFAYSASRPKLKVCVTCHLELSLEDFHKAPANRDGLNTSCKVCRTKYIRERILAKQAEVPADQRTCIMCMLDLPKDQFYRDSYSHDKLRTKCKDCCKKQYAERMNKLTALRSEQSESEPIVEQLAVTESAQVGSKDDSLYIITNPLIPNMVKIGRAANPYVRAHDLSRSQPFQLVVSKVYPKWGLLEKAIHRRLKAQQVTTGRGTEWFTVDERQVEVIIEATILEFKLNH
jgi:hypothetical protein